MNKLLLLSVLTLSLVVLGAGCSTSEQDAPALGQQKVSFKSEAIDPSALERVMRSFYSFLDEKKYDEAYGLLSPSFRTRLPFEKWKSGYRNTLSHTIKSLECMDDSCTVEFVATENNEKGLRKQKYGLRYDFIKDAQNNPQIITGTLLSTETVEVIKAYSGASIFGDSDVIASVVEIICFTDSTYSEPLSTGSGTIISKNGIVLSNFHVKAPPGGACGAVTVDSHGVIQTDRIYFVGDSLLEDPLKDIWVFRLVGTMEEQFTALPYRPCKVDQIRLGDTLRVYGFPLRAAGGNMVVTDGLISGVNRGDGSYVISAKIDHGNSGGTAINTSRGCFLGIPTAISGESEIYGQVTGIGELAQRYPELFQ